MSLIHLSAAKQTEDIKAIPISELHCHVKDINPVFLNNVVDSIEGYGLQNPIVVVAMTIERWKHMKYVNSEILDPPEGLMDQEVLQVRCGNNRVKAAIALGYESIDCVVARDLRAGSRLCSIQGKEQDKWRNTNQYGKWGV